MEQLYSIYHEYAGYFTSYPMFPVLNCVHFTIVTLKLRMKLGTAFAQTNPLACWVSALISNFAGTLLVNFLLGLPLVLPLQNVPQMTAMTVIWYLVFYCPFDIFTKMFMFQPAWIGLVILKEARRAKGILGGVQMGNDRYPDALLIIVLLGVCKGAGALLVRPVASFIHGSLDISSHEALKPSFVTKISMVISVLYMCSHKGVIPISAECLCLGVFLFLSLVQVSLYTSKGQDPFIRFEKTLSPLCFGTPQQKADTSDSKKKKQ